MIAARIAVALIAVVAAGPGRAADAEPAWSFGVTAYPTVVRNGDNYTSAIATANRGGLHLEARVNYEAVGARSAFVGWTFSGGGEVTWEVTPVVGGAWGDVEAFIPGVEASIGWRKFDLYVEAEYVRDHAAREDSYWFAWTELGFRPIEPLRLGVAGQRTRAYGGDRDIQRGPFAQVTWRNVTLGGYWFNPGSSDQVFIGSIGATF